ncbi:MAG: hypothetical protein ACKOQ2_29245 [Dolichospermum sp.]
MNKQQWLLTQIAKFPELSARELASKLNDKVLVDNPLPQQQIPILPTLEEALGIVTPEEQFAIAETWTYDRLLSSINQQRWDLVAVNLETLKNGKLLSEDSYGKIIALLQKTQPDPNYQAQVWLSPAENAGFKDVLVNEIEELLTT